MVNPFYKLTGKITTEFKRNYLKGRQFRWKRTGNIVKLVKKDPSRPGGRPGLRASLKITFAMSGPTSRGCELPQRKCSNKEKPSLKAFYLTVIVTVAAKAGL